MDVYPNIYSGTWIFRWLDKLGNRMHDKLAFPLLVNEIPKGSFRSEKRN